MNGRRISPCLVVPALLVILGAAGCHDDPKPAAVPVLGDWVATITETSDSCDDLVEPVMDVSIEITDEGDSYYVWIYDLGSDSCWVQPFEIGEETLFWYGGWRGVANPCNDGCTVEVYSTVTLEFHAGGLFTGTETVTFTPLDAACDHPDCQFPCETQDRHMVFPPLIHGCAFDCETVYTWTGAITSDMFSRSCS